MREPVGSSVADCEVETSVVCLASPLPLSSLWMVLDEEDREAGIKGDGGRVRRVDNLCGCSTSASVSLACRPLDVDRGVGEPLASDASGEIDRARCTEGSRAADLERDSAGARCEASSAGNDVVDSDALAVASTRAKMVGAVFIVGADAEVGTASWTERRADWLLLRAGRFLDRNLEVSRLKKLREPSGVSV